jgi:hypothetical protein
VKVVSSAEGRVGFLCAGMAAAVVGVSDCGVYDLDEGLRHLASVEGFAPCANAHISESRYGATGDAVEED